MSGPDIAAEVRATLSRWRAVRDQLPPGSPLRRCWNVALDRLAVLEDRLIDAGAGKTVHLMASGRRQVVHALLGTAPGEQHIGELQRAGLGQWIGGHVDNWKWHEGALLRLPTSQLDLIYERVTDGLPDLPEPDPA